MLELALLDTRNGTKAPAVASLLQELLPQQLSHYYELRSAKRRKEYLFSRLLLNLCLRAHLSNNRLTELYQETSTGPQLTATNYFVSLSHSYGVMAVGLSNQPLGIDIELMKPRKNLHELAGLFMTLSELDCFLRTSSNCQQDAFYQAWTAKEAIYKSLPREEQEAIGLSDITLNNRQGIDRSVLNQKCLGNDFMLSVCCTESKS